jgi:hypothetical protein
MKKFWKKVIAPVIIVIFTMLNLAVAPILLFLYDLPGILKIVIVSLSIAAAGVLLYVLIERIKEIKQGVEDDLGKY